MSNTHRFVTSRREFLQQTGGIAVASALAATAIPHVHAAENNTIQVALIGCGGRGTGAAANALSTKNGPIKLVAMADIFEQKLATSSRKPEAAVRRPGRRARGPQVSSASTRTRRPSTA